MQRSIPSKAASFIVLMLFQVVLRLPHVSAQFGSGSGSLFTDVDSPRDTATVTVESLFGQAQGLQLGGSILAAVSIIVGGVMVVFGFKLMRATLFAIGFVAGGVAIAMIAERMFRDETWVVMASWIAFGVGGILCGGVILYLYPLSTFVAGAATGVMTAMILTNSVGYLIYPGHTTDLLILMCVVLGILFGVLALKLGKPVLIVSTSLFGAGLVAWGVGYFVGDFPTPNDLEQYASEDINGDTVYSIPAAWWGYLAGIIVLFVFGVYIQSCKTARNVKDNRPKGFGKRVDVNEYVEKKTQRNQNQDRPVMEAPRRQRQVRRERPVREERQPRQVREVREQQTPSKNRSTKQPKQQTPRPMARRRPYADMNATDDVVQYEERAPQQYSMPPRRQYVATDDVVQSPQQYPTPLRRQYADLNATDEIVEYDEQFAQPKRVIYSERESDLYDFEASREPCRICGDYVHRDSSCCSEKVVRIDRR